MTAMPPTPDALATGLRGPYRATAATRARILDAAHAEFAEHGYDGASVRAIAARAGMSHTSLLHHFAGKQELFVALLERRERLDRALVPVDPDAVLTPAALAALLAAVIDRYRADPAMNRLWSGLIAAVSGDPTHPAHPFVTRRYARWTAEFTTVLERAQAAGHVAASVDAQVAAVGLLALLQGLLTHALIDPDLDVRAVIAAGLAPLGSDATAAARR